MTLAAGASIVDRALREVEARKLLSLCAPSFKYKIRMKTPFGPTEKWRVATPVGA